MAGTGDQSAKNLAEVLVGDLEARRLADTPAILCENEPTSYAELAARSAGLAHALEAFGIQRQARVLLLLADSPDLVVTFLALLRLAAVPVLLNPRLGASELSRIRRHAEPQLTVTDDQTSDLAATLTPGAACWRYDETPPAERVTAGASIDEFRPVSACDMAYWLYSSGTTGAPKAVVHTHRAGLIAERYLSECLDLEPGQRILTTSKLFFAYALGHGLLGALKAGATTVLSPRWPSPELMARLVEDTAPDLVFSVPTLYQQLLTSGAADAPAFARVRSYVSAGEPLPTSVYRAWMDRTGKPILQGIGTSESTFLFVASRPDDHAPGALGRALPWAEVMLRSDGGDAITGPDQPGTLWVAMASLFREYWNDPERTAAVRDGAWYCTGDVARIDTAGRWHYQGRRDEMFKISGQWVSPAEIEQAAFATAGVKDAAAVCIGGEDGFARSVLFVVPRADTAGDALTGAVARDLATRLPRFKRPAAVRCMDEIPRTATGKVKRFVLAERAR